AFCCRSGGHLGSGDRSTLTALGRYGRHMGRLWHVAEDVAALEVGGEGAADHLVARALAGRPVLPVIVSPDPAVLAHWSALVANPHPDVAGRALEGVSRSG